MPEKKHIAILIAFGPEVRAFIYSGLAQKLAERWKVTIFTVAPESKALETLDPAIQVVPLLDTREKPGLKRMRYWAMQAHQEWLRSKGWRHWQHYIAPVATKKNNTIKRLFIALMRRRFFLALFLQAERLAGRTIGTHPDWQRALSDIDCILTATFSSERILPALQTSSNLSVASVVVMNSWKDVYTNPHMPVIPDRVAVWTDDVADDLHFANWSLSRRNISVFPSLHLQKFLTPDSIMPRDQFCADMGLDASCPYICYTAASPKAVYHEERIVESLLRAIADRQFPGKPQLLLRTNPMEDGSRFRPLAAQYPDLVLQKPNWEWNPERDWNCALLHDVESWVATVYHSRLNISIPSTVTLEYLTLGRPVINICFDAVPVDQPDHSNARFWNASFYADMREHPLVQPAFSFEELVVKTRQVLEGQTGDPVATSAPVTVSPAQKTYQIIEELLAR